MRRWLPFPIVMLLLLTTWLLLNETLAIEHVLIGAALAAGGAFAYARLQPPMGKAGRVGAAIVLLWRVSLDIVRSNIGVARIVLNLGSRKATSGFLDVPLRLRHPVGLAILASIVTATPGTSWVAYDAERGVLTLHILDLVDKATWIDTITSRYESKLLEIFQ